MKIYMVFLMCFTPILVSLCLSAKVDPAVGPCECAVFRTLDAKMMDTPILKQNPMNVTCDETGQTTCVKMCTALAQAAKARGPALLCATLQHADALTAHVCARSCEAASWTHTNMSSTEPICCHEGVPITCKVKQ